MPQFQVNLEGIPVTVTTRQVDVSKLCLDSENPRIGLYRDSQPKQQLSEADIRHAIRNRSPHAYGKLRDSIEINKGVINPIWISPEHEGNHLVIEGNTRVLIYRELATKFPNAEEWRTISANVLPVGINDSQVTFIRLEAHLRGVTEWDAYERARYLYILNEKEGYSINRLEQLTRLDARDIQIEIRAFRDMADTYHTSYPNDPYEAQKFSYFVEFERNSKIKRGMQSRGKTLDDFCTWVGDEKIPKAEHVRRLADILDDSKATDQFVTDGYDKALSYLALAKPDLVSPLFQRIEDVIDRLRRMPFYEIEELRSGDQPARARLIRELAETSSKICDRISDSEDASDQPEED